MKDNPYSKLIEQMKKQGATSNPPSVQIGEVISPNPLTIRIGDLQIDKDNILMADYLLKEYKRKVKIPEATATGETNNVSVGDHGTHKHSVDKIGINEVEIIFLDTFKQGDKLAVLSTEDKQTYIILARVVSL
jgi:hypothetical protein